MIEMTKKLAPEQKRPLKYAVKFCYDMLLAEKNPGFDMEPLRLIIHGGAGKSFLSLKLTFSCFHLTSRRECHCPRHVKSEIFQL